MLTKPQYRARDRPWYRFGHVVVLAYICAGLISSIIFRIFLARENKRRERGERDEIILANGNKSGDAKNGTFATVEEAKAEKGDNYSGFRYTL